jgi:hypothetical protein
MFKKYKYPIIMLIVSFGIIITLNFHLLIVAKLLNLNEGQINDLIPSFRIYAGIMNIISLLLIAISMILLAIRKNRI